MFRPCDSCRRVRSLRRNDTVTANRRVCEFIGKTQLNISLLHFKAICFKAPVELWTPTNASCWGSVTACTSCEISEVEADVPPMRQGETEGREGALGHSCRRVRSLRRNDTVTANRRVCEFIGKTQLSISLLYFKARCFKAPLELCTPTNASCWVCVFAGKSVKTL